VVPSVTMMRVAEEAMTPMLRALECVVPLSLPAADLVRVPGFIGAAAGHVVVPFLNDGFTPVEAFPEIRALLVHDFGFLILCYLIGTMRGAPDGSILAEAPSVMLSRRFGVSRSQVRNVLAVCRDAGWILAVARGGHRIRIAPCFADLSERWIAHDLACWARAVRAASSRARAGNGASSCETLHTHDKRRSVGGVFDLALGGLPTPGRGGLRQLRAWTLDYGVAQHLIVFAPGPARAPI
jgi:hypothetical protein